VRAPLVIASVVAALGASAAGCGSSSDGDGGSARTLSFKLTDAGCEPATATAPAGEIEFEVTNDGAGSVTEFEVLEGDEVLGEKEDLTEGLSGSFSLTLAPGSYTLYCPNGTESERGTLKVTEHA